MALKRDPNWNFKAVGAQVPAVTAKCVEKFGFHTAEIITNWPIIVGAALGAYTRPFRIKWARRPDAIDTEPDAPPARPQKTALEIYVDGGRAHEMTYRAPQIIERINGYFGYRAITEIRAQDGELKAPAKAAGAARVVAVPGLATGGTLAASGDDLSAIADPGLRAALTRLGAARRGAR